MSTTYTISELAKEFGVTTRTIRFYEDQGLLSPKREGTNRVFSPRDRVRLKLALRGKRLGFSLAEIRELFELYDVSRDEQQAARGIPHQAGAAPGRTSSSSARTSRSCCARSTSSPTSAGGCSGVKRTVETRVSPREDLSASWIRN